MTLIDNWRGELNRLWSVRIAILTAVLASGDQIISALNGAGVISPFVYGLLSIAFTVARMVQQKPA